MTVLTSYIGYDKVGQIVKYAQENDVKSKWLSIELIYLIEN